MTAKHGSRANVIRASLNYRSGYGSLRLTLEAQNLTNEWAAQYSDSRRKDPLYQTLTGRTYTMGASYRF